MTRVASCQGTVAAVELQPADVSNTLNNKKIPMPNRNQRPKRNQVRGGFINIGWTVESCSPNKSQSTAGGGDTDSKLVGTNTPTTEDCGTNGTSSPGFDTETPSPRVVGKNVGKLLLCVCLNDSASVIFKPGIVDKLARDSFGVLKLSGNSNFITVVINM